MQDLYHRQYCDSLLIISIVSIQPHNPTLTSRPLEFRSLLIRPVGSLYVGFKGARSGCRAVGFQGLGLRALDCGFFWFRVPEGLVVRV